MTKPRATRHAQEKGERVATRAKPSVHARPGAEPPSVWTDLGAVVQLLSVGPAQLVHLLRALCQRAGPELLTRAMGDAVLAMGKRPGTGPTLGDGTLRKRAVQVMCADGFGRLRAMRRGTGVEFGGRDVVDLVVQVAGRNRDNLADVYRRTVLGRDCAEALIMAVDELASQRDPAGRSQRPDAKKEHNGAGDEAGAGADDPGKAGPE